MIEEKTAQAFVIAKRLAPKDTYNLVLNGMRTVTTEDIGEIIYDGSVIPYLDHLEYGTKYYDGHKGFISVDTVDAVKSLMYGQFDNDEYNQANKEVSGYKPTQRTNARYLQSIGGESLVSE